MDYPSTAAEIGQYLASQAPGLSERVTGFQYATVTNVDDPLSLMRVKVRFDWMEVDQESAWLPPAAGYSGDGWGSTFGLPITGDRIKIAFLNGNPHNPEWQGSFFTPGGQAAISDARPVRPPKGREDAVHDGKRGSRLNILRSMSGWLIQLLEGVNVSPDWEGWLVDPLKRSWLRWVARGGRLEARLDTFLRVDDTQSAADTASLEWDAAAKTVTFELHQAGKLIIRDREGDVLTWDAAAKTITLHAITEVKLTSATKVSVNAPLVEIAGGGPPIARLGDTVQVSATTHLGTITSGSPTAVCG